MSATAPPIPAPHPGDAEEVAWALSTAATLRGEGEHGRAAQWLRRAADRARDVGRVSRATDLDHAADALAAASDASATEPFVPEPSIDVDIDEAFAGEFPFDADALPGAGGPELEGPAPDEDDGATMELGSDDVSDVVDEGEYELEPDDVAASPLPLVSRRSTPPRDADLAAGSADEPWPSHAPSSSRGFVDVRVRRVAPVPLATEEFVSSAPSLEELLMLEGPAKRASARPRS
jgi:hypothetical protein